MWWDSGKSRRLKCTFIRTDRSCWVRSNSFCTHCFISRKIRIFFFLSKRLVRTFSRTKHSLPAYLRDNIAVPLLYGVISLASGWSKRPKAKQFIPAGDLADCWCDHELLQGSRVPRWVLTPQGELGWRSHHLPAHAEMLPASDSTPRPLLGTKRDVLKQGGVAKLMDIHKVFKH